MYVYQYPWLVMINMCRFVFYSIYTYMHYQSEMNMSSMYFKFYWTTVKHIIGILHEGAEQRSVLHEAGQNWWTNPKGEFTRFDQAECNTLLRSVPECCIPFITCRFSCDLVQFLDRAIRQKILNSALDQWKRLISLRYVIKDYRQNVSMHL